jgi:selenocysteine-specific elongation factor
MLAEAGGGGLAVDDLPVRAGASPEAIEAALTAAGSDVVRLGRRIFAAAERERIVAALVHLVEAHHLRYPLDVGATLQTVRAQLLGQPDLIDDALRTARERGHAVIEGGIVKRHGWAPRLSGDQEVLKTVLAESVRVAGAEPPSLSELGATHGPSVAPLMRILEREGVIVPVESDRYYSKEAVDSLVSRLRSEMAPGREYSPSELRDVIGISRKFLIPFLEFCDRSGVTERRSGGRVIHAG